MQCNCDDNIDIQLGKVKESTKVCFESQGNFEVCLTKEFASLASSFNACIIRKIQDDVSVIICKVNSQQTTLKYLRVTPKVIWVVPEYTRRLTVESNTNWNIK